MKFSAAKIFIIVILLCMGILFIKNLDEELLSTSDSGYLSKVSILDEIDKKLTQFTSFEKSQNTSSDSFQVYKWTDEKGITHYSDKNSPRIQSKLTELDPITIVPAYKIKPVVRNSINDSKQLSNLPGLTTIPVHQIPKLIEDSKQIKNLLENRKNEMDEVINAH